MLKCMTMNKVVVLAVVVLVVGTITMKLVLMMVGQMSRTNMIVII